MTSLQPSRDDFASLLEEALGGRDLMEGSVVHGLVTGVEKDFVIVDVGLKTEGRVPLREFIDGDTPAPKKGDTVEVFLERVENALGEAVISREKAKREEAWTRLEVVFAEGQPVNGAIVGRVKGGFTVDLGGASAFLPGSQVDIRPVRDVGPLMGKEQALRHPQDGPAARQHRRLASRHPGGGPRRAAHRARRPAARGRGCARAWSRTSPTTAPSWTWAASTACCTSPT